MANDAFTPFGSELDSRPAPQFIGHGEDSPAATPAAPPRVTPAEAVDLSGKIREILKGQLPETDLNLAISAIETAINSTPTRVALPEIKLNTDGDSTPPEGQPSLEFEREGDTVKRVQVHCACGQSIHLDCVY